MQRSIDTVCGKCGHKETQEIEIQVHELNKHGFAVNSKGAFISELIAKKGKISTNDLFVALTSQYPKANNLGRLNDVIGKMKKRGIAYVNEGMIHYRANGTTKPAAKQEAKVPEATK